MYSICCIILLIYNFDGLVQDCSNSSALAMELLQSYTKPLICPAEIWAVFSDFDISLGYTFESLLTSMLYFVMLDIDCMNLITEIYGYTVKSVSALFFVLFFLVMFLVYV